MSYQKHLQTFLTNVCVISFLLVGPGFTEEEENQEDTEQAATNHMANIIYSPFAQNADYHLSAKGLAQPAIDDTVDQITIMFAECIVGSLKKANNEETKYAIDLIATGALEEEISAYFDSLQVEDSADPLEVFEIETDVCFKSIDASYGLSE